MKKAVSVEKPKAAAKKTVSKSVEKAPEKNYFEVRLPKFSFRNASLNAYLVFALVVFAFLLGMLTNKVIYLEKTANAPVPTAAPTDQQVAAPEPPAVVKVDNGKLPLMGEENAKVTIVIFSDLQCPFCKRYVDETHKALIEKYVNTGKAKLYFRHYPLYSIHPLAEKAGIATECANDQGKFWDYHDLLFANQDSWSGKELTTVDESLIGYASELGLDADQFSSCLESDKAKNAVTQDAAAGEKVQVDGTPTFFINGHRLVGAQPLSEFETLIEAELKK